MRASRSASSSQALTWRIPSSRAGMPVGNSDCSSCSRSTGAPWPFADLRVRRVLAAERAVGGREAVWVAGRGEPVVFGRDAVVVERAAVLPLEAERAAAALPVRVAFFAPARAAAEAPATPCARLRCAPNE